MASSASSFSTVLPHLFCALFFLLPLFAIAQTLGNLTLGSSISAPDEKSFLASPSGEFSFGFYPLPEENLFLPSIWFTKVPVKPIVWTANKVGPVQKGAKFELKNDGTFVLNDHQGKEIWRATPIDGSQVASASMLDNGNFVLVRTENTVIWESFDDGSDTILPDQILGLGQKLVSRLSKDNYSTGRFELRLQTDGNLVLYTVARPTDDAYDPYWASNTVGSESQLVFNQSGYIYLNLGNGTSLDLSSEKPVSTRDFYNMAKLDFDGVLRQYSYPKSIPSNGSSWSVVWSLPEDICQAIRWPVGSGACGYNSYCKLEQNQPSCVCPPGYEYLDPKNTLQGCKPMFAPQSCKTDGSSSAVTDGFEMRPVTSVDWPDSDFEWFKKVDEDWCSQSCLNDCYCAVAITRDGNCWKKRFPLSNGKLNPKDQGKALVKVGNSSLQPDLPPRFGPNKSDKDHLILPGSILLGSSLFINLLLFLVIFWVVSGFYHKKSITIQQVSSTFEMNPQSFTYKELEVATNGFKEELGRGAFGTVYKGVLELGSRKTLIAVKRLNKVVQESDKEFKTEVNVISKTNHKNLVQLLGFCHEGTHQLLVYEYMSNGSLASFLFGSSRPSWSQRTQIVLGIARGLTYLHEDCITKIIHCDVKSQNILLDDSFVAKISDFGLAKLLKTDQTQTLTSIRGTRGYLAPEWFRNMPIKAKVDVYSFGIVLLEIICCRKNVQSPEGDEEQEILSYWSYDCYREGRLHLLVGNDEEAMNDVRGLERFVMVALWCIQEDPYLRPSMKEVTQMLEGSIEVYSPPDPSSFMIASTG